MIFPIHNMVVLDEPMAAILRQKTPAERLAMADAMWRFDRDTIRVNLRREHPDWAEEAIDREVARRLSHGAV